MDTIENKIKEVLPVLDNATELLLNRSQECAKSGEPNGWKIAQTLFGWAKRVDELRREMCSPVEDISSTMRRTKFPASSYPRYAVAGDTLTKTALTKDGSEYAQSVPRDVFEGILAGMRGFAEEAEDFQTERVVGRMSAPMYQVYVVLGVLRKMGLIEPVKRGVFKFVARQRFSDDAKEIWNRISNNKWSTDSEERGECNEKSQQRDAE